MSDELVLERSGNVLIMRLNRPEARNALTGTLVRAISTAVLDAEADPEIRVIVFTGTGDRAFCGGMDLADFAGSGEDEFADLAAMEGFRRVVHGELACQSSAPRTEAPSPADSNSSSAATSSWLRRTLEFGLPEVKRGLFPVGGGTFLAMRLPLGIAMELALTGDYIDAQRAQHLGLVNKVVAPELVLTRRSSTPIASPPTARWPSPPRRNSYDSASPTTTEPTPASQNSARRSSPATTPGRRHRLHGKAAPVWRGK